MRFKLGIFLLALGLIVNSFATEKEKKVTPERQWSVLVYGGATSVQQLGTLIRGKFNSAGETLYTVELAYILDQNNWFRKFVSPVVDTVQLAANITKRDARKDPNAVYEYDGYVIFRWTKFPWREYLHTSLAAGEGISYASHVPFVEEGTTSNSSRRLLNYLVFEVTAALPSHPNLELVGRIHHRSTAYGVFGNGNAGSNTIGLGIRYYF